MTCCSSINLDSRGLITQAILIPQALLFFSFNVLIDDCEQIVNTQQMPSIELQAVVSIICRYYSNPQVFLWCHCRDSGFSVVFLGLLHWTSYICDVNMHSCLLATSLVATTDLLGIEKYACCYSEPCCWSCYSTSFQQSSPVYCTVQYPLLGPAFLLYKSN